MRKLNRFIPGFLKKADLYLLENHPMLWVSKIHYVAFFSFVLVSLVGIWSLVVPMNFASPPEPEAFFALLFIPSAIGAAIWALFQLVFNAEKNYGKSSMLSDLSRQGLYLLILGLFLSAPWLSATFTNAKTALSISQTELCNDINTLNQGYLIFNSRPRETEYVDYYSFPFTPYDFISDQLYSEDQLKKLDLSVRTRAEVGSDLEDFEKVFFKYGGEGYFGDPNILDNYFSGKRYQNNSYLVQTYPVERNIQKIANAKAWDYFLMDTDVILATLFAIFCISCILLMLKNVSIKHFLIATVVGLLSIPVVAVIGEMAREIRIADNDDTVVLTMIAIFIFVAFQSFSIFKLKKFSGLKAVSLVLFNASLPFLFIFSLFLVDEYMTYDYWPSSEERWIAIYAGVAAHFLIWVHVLKRMYRRLQSLPA